MDINTLVVEQRRQFGNVRFFPINETARILAEEVTKTTCLDLAVLYTLKHQFGFEVQVIQPAEVTI